MQMKQIIFLFLLFRVQQGLTLLLRIFIKDEKSGLRSSLLKIVWDVDIF